MGREAREGTGENDLTHHLLQIPGYATGSNPWVQKWKIALKFDRISLYVL